MMKIYTLDLDKNQLLKSVFTILILMVGMLSATIATAINWNVTSTADAGPNTLRDAIDNSLSGDVININVFSEIKIDSGLYVFLKDLTINGNGATINSSNSKDYTFILDITNITINDLTMINLSKNFPVITATNAGQVTLNNCTIRDNTTTSNTGGAIFSNIPVKLNNCSILNNTAQNAGAFYMDYNDLTINNTKINGNTATGNNGTGGIFCRGPFKMTNSEIIGNNASNGSTGGLQVFNSGTVEISGSKINNNTGKTGAGGCLIIGALDLTNSEIINNSCNGIGGGIWFLSFGGTVPSSITNSTINQNTAKSSGGINYTGSSLTINGSHIDQNKAILSSGGGLFIGSGKINLKNSTVNNNVAKSFGGGIYTNVDCTVDGSEVNGNTSSDKGGGIYTFRGKVELKNQSEVNGNTAQIDGGGIYVDNNIEASLSTHMADISGNTAGGNGGGVYLSTIGDFLNTTFHNNSANGPGGGLYIKEVGGAKLNISGSTINHNSASYGGGIMLYHNTNANTISNCTLKNNEVTQQGGGLWLKANASISSTTFENNSADTQGGGIFMDLGSSTLTASSVIMNEANQGAGIYIRTGNLQVNSTAINQNKSVNEGGGIYFKEGTLSLLSQSSINNNESISTSGGGIYVDNGNLTLSSSEVNNNTVKNGGGGIYLNDNPSVAFQAMNSSINNNSTQLYGGGGLLIKANSLKKTIINCTIQGNTSYLEGGGIFNHGELEIQSNSIINNNESLTSKGGGIYNTGNLSIDQSAINQNKAKTEGGGLYVYSGMAEIKNTTIKQNEAITDGGGVYSRTKLTIENNSIINDNKAGQTGGGLWISHIGLSSTISHSDVNGNTARKAAGIFIGDGSLSILQGSNVNDNQNTDNFDGAGIYNWKAALTINGSSISNNSTQAHGGGIYVDNNTGASLSIDMADISGNTAGGNGGGVYLSTTAVIQNSTFNNNSANGPGGGLYIRELGGAQLNISGSTINNNSASHGGGIILYHNNNANTISNCTLKNNKVTQQGGGLWLKANTSISSTTFENNSANIQGGGIFMDFGTSTLTASSVVKNEANLGAGIYILTGNLTITGQSSINMNIAESSGGGIYSNHALLTIKNSTVNNNSSYTGGGIFSNAVGFLLTLEGSEVSGNKAASFGGGIFSRNNLMIKQMIISENDADIWSGGGIFAEKGNVTMEDNSLIQSNTAGQFGGGLHLQEGVHNIKNSDITDNTSGNSGGGIFFNKQSLTLDHVNVNNNLTGSKGGGIHFEQGALTINNSAINGNSAYTWGGGIYSSYLSGANSFSINNSQINRNSANNGGGISVDVINNYSISQTEFINNKANGNGGAINIIGGTGMVDISQVTIMNNKANRGGGIHNTSLDLMVKNSTITNNQSSHHGGGIYNHTYKITLTNSKINGNTSDSNGGGIWNNGTLDISDSEIRDNTAQNRGGGIHTFGTATCRKVILEGNSATDGGGLTNIGTMTIDYSTITNNTADNGGGIQNLQYNSNHGNLNLNNSIIALNLGSHGTDIDNGATISGDHNLLSDYANSGLTTNNTNNLIGDPLFVSNFSNLNLIKCSPAIDAAGNGDDMGAIQSGLTAIVPVITTASFTISLDHQHPNMVSISSSMVQYNFMGCTDISISLAPVDFDCSHVGQSVTTTATVTYSGGQSFQQTIPVTVLDQVAPQFTQFPSDTVYVAAGDPVPAPDPGSYADNCGGTVTLTVSDSNLSTLECGDKMFRTYTITDVHGNNHSFVQVIIIGDGMGPEITVWDDERMDITDLMTPPVYAVRHDTAYTSFTTEDELARYCGQSRLIRRTYIAQDVCHNTTTKTLDILFSDEEKPVLIREADFLQDVENGDTIDWVDCIYPEPSRNDISWSDNSGSAIVRTHVYNLPLPKPVPFGMFKFLNYVYQVEDDCGNRTELNFYMGLYDLQGPVYQYIPHDTVITSTVDLPPVPEDVIILDVCNYVVWDTVVTRPILDPATGDTTAFSRKWIARDVVGHETFEEQIIHIKPDKDSYGEVMARVAYFDQLVPEHFDGEIGANGISFVLYWLDDEPQDTIRVNSTFSQNWFGKNGSAWMTGISPGSYQLKVNVPEGFYIRENNLVDSLSWSDTLVFSGQKIDLGLLVLAPVPEDPTSDAAATKASNSVDMESENTDIVNKTAQTVLRQKPVLSHQKQWNVYPNPASGRITIDFASDDILDYSILDRAGKRVLTGKTSSGEVVNLDGLVNGLYILQMRQGREIVGHKKLVLMR